MEGKKNMMMYGCLNEDKLTVLLAVVIQLPVQACDGVCSIINGQKVQGESVCQALALFCRRTGT